ncbi:hypothetical protein ACFLWC_01645 [Chloroflexota bacterium]
MTKHTIEITIVDDKQRRECDTECGADWSSAEAIALAKQRIKDRFVENIELAYLDLSQPPSELHTLELNREIENKNLSLPLLLVNGQPRISGQFDIRQLLDVIEAETELGV